MRKNSKVEFAERSAGEIPQSTIFRNSTFRIWQSTLSPNVLLYDNLKLITNPALALLWIQSYSAFLVAQTVLPVRKKIVQVTLILFSVRRTDRSNAKFATFSSGKTDNVRLCRGADGMPENRRTP